jgi:hypothetical protein
MYAFQICIFFLYFQTADKGGLLYSKYVRKQYIRIEYGIRCLNLEKTVNAFVASETSYS